MKYILITFILCSCGNPYPKEERALKEAENVAMPEYYRHITGYDSVEVIFFMGKWKVNFCYPNEWERNKYKFDSIINSPQVKIGNIKGDYITDKAVKNVYNK